MHEKRIYTLYLSTLTPSTYNFAPVYKTNLSTVKWSTDWNRVFGDLCGRADCLVRIRLISRQNSVANLPYDSNLGTVRCNFYSPYQQQNNGVIIGTLNVQQLVTNNNCLSCDTSMTTGVRIRVPNTNSYFNIQLVGMNELLTPCNVEYEIQMDFEIIEDSVQSYDD
jgi:hypothetical protein